MELGRFDSVSIAGIAAFSALATLLAALSQSLGLNFPLIPYLQFDLGEVAIVMAFFVFGPLPAVASSFVEFFALFLFGQNVPVGPVLKLLSLLSTIGGMWLGSRLALMMRKLSVGRMVTASALTGSLARATLMTIPNYYIVVFLYSLPGIEGLVRAPFAFVGISLTGSNALALVLGFTAVFNVLQLVFVVALSYAVLRFPALSSFRAGGKAPWFVSVTGGRATARSSGEEKIP